MHSVDETDTIPQTFQTGENLQGVGRRYYRVLFYVHRQVVKTEFTTL